MKMNVRDFLRFKNKYKEPDFPAPKYMDPDVFIANHHHVCYCEAIINDKGLIAYAIPSHQKAIFGDALTKVKYEYKTPVSEFSLEKCCDDFKKVLVWYDYVLIGSNNPNPKQVRSVYKLKESGCISAEAWKNLCDRISFNNSK